ncbi:hypothetical protein Vadar_015722 [Vaccinium darrowii]|uniref:Uncharacterized protein n=1 Tax=Vaccinium darrowii TaxID=229202 RepID=A0ACB7ZBT6_9ERIC|nr:hypothetical protein Vadar_015722 [Vaccinium darrowii]
MPQPTWLPPLNAHNSYKIFVNASQNHPPLSSSPPSPAATGPALSIKVNVSVNFFSSDSTVQRAIWGLDVWESFLLPSANTVFDMIDQICSTPFQMDRIFWNSWIINGDNYLSHVENEYDFKETLLNFLWEVINASCNAGMSVLAVTLEIEKEVEITADEFASWASWYDENAGLSESFEREYKEAISRPRGEREVGIVLPDMIYEGVGGKEECSICLEEFVVGSRVARLPCSHLYHGDCVLKWLKRSNACPLCRQFLPTSLFLPRVSS